MTLKKKLAEFAHTAKSRGKLAFFLDIDGTIISRCSENGVSKRLAEAISKAQQNGHLFFINSGRAIGYIPEALLESANFDGVVSGLGAHIFYHGKTVFRSAISISVIKEVVDYCAKHREAIIFESEHSGPSAVNGRYAMGYKEFFIQGKIPLEDEFLNPELSYAFEKKDKYLSDLTDKSLLKITVPYVPCAEYSHFLENFFDMTYLPPIYAEGALHGNNKGTGINRVCELLEIPYENTVAVGDSENDINMLKVAGLSAAMGSAPEAVKNMCDVVCDTVENDGAAKLIEALILRQEQAQA